MSDEQVPSMALVVYNREVIQNTSESIGWFNNFLEQGTKLAKYAEHLAPIFKLYSLYNSFLPSKELVAIRELSKQMQEQSSMILKSLDSLRSDLPAIIKQGLREHHLETMLVQLYGIDEAARNYRASEQEDFKARAVQDLAEVRKACSLIRPMQVLDFIKQTYSASDEEMCGFYDALDWNIGKVHKFMLFLENLTVAAKTAGFHCLVTGEVFMSCSEREQERLINQENLRYTEKIEATRQALRPVRCDKMKELFWKNSKGLMFAGPSIRWDTELWQHHMTFSKEYRRKNGNK